MKPRYIEGLITHLLREYAEGDQDGVAEKARITSVQTFEEGGYTDKPVGVVIECGDGSKVFCQFVGTSPSGGNYPEEPLYYEKAPHLVGTERFSNGKHQVP